MLNKKKTIMKFNSQIINIILLTFLSISFTKIQAQTNEDCLMCHEDTGLTTERNGKTISLYVDAAKLKKSVHNKIECISCHKDAADPDFKHSEQLVKLKEVNCGNCHTEYAEQVKNDIHSKLNVGNKKPDCKICHGKHDVKKLASIQNKSKSICGKCHQQNVLSGTYHVKNEINASCVECHDQKNYMADLARSVHKGLSCSNCHGYVASHIDEHQDNPEMTKTADCYLCHGPIAEEHKESIHGISLAEGINEAAQCWNCHGTHEIYPVKSDSSSVYPKNLPFTCGKCHDDPGFNKRHFSIVKQPGKLYLNSVHGKLVESGRMDAASCVTCHGVHNIKNRIQNGSKISAVNISNTCAKCHKEIVEEYKNSIHWIAVRKGVREAPTCNDCHSEHSIQAVNTIDKREEIEKLQENTCLQCHKNLILSKRYGINPEYAGNYQDSYHGLAVMRGDGDAAMCIDCHGKHSILPKYHEKSTINKNNVLQTCKKCHNNATQVFAESYSHTIDKNSSEGIIQSWVKSIYFWMILIVIGGMALHNMIIFIYDIRKKRNKLKQEIRIPRLNSNEVVQHLILIISFSILAITGFQLKFPDSWWAKGLNIFIDETVRQNVHRSAAVTMILLSIYHAFYLIFTSRGREIVVSILPKISDIRLAIQNVMYHIGLRKQHPEFENYNYIEKAEYWALIWGTLVMGATGFVLWFPTVVGNWAPTWLIKVSEIVHYYEAILATLAIVIWHWFFVIYRPMLKFTFIDGKMTLKYYKIEHKLKFKQIVAEYIDMKNGKIPENKLSNYTNLFIKTIEQQNVNVDEFIQQELANDADLREYVEKRGN